ncbi:MAG: transposase, partial [Nitrospiraceae bacterium]|nr:transposase [Nitrospiraceae bacterium]
MARLPLLQKDGDYEAFERVLAEAIARHPIRVLGYCLMPNHWHFVLWPQHDGGQEKGTQHFSLLPTVFPTVPFALLSRFDHADISFRSLLERFRSPLGHVSQDVRAHLFR